MDWNGVVANNEVSPAVTPFVGVWIETRRQLDWLSPFFGHTLRGCVDWNSQHPREMFIPYNVTPFVGVWIETWRIWIGQIYQSQSHTLRGCVDWNPNGGVAGDYVEIVTPFVGVWIETKKSAWRLRTLCSHTLRGCVDWNILTACSWASLGGHTLRGCVDWNSPTCVTFFTASASHPSWVCGLKQTGDSSNADVSSHTLRGCVDWTWLPACYTLSK